MSHKKEGRREEENTNKFSSTAATTMAAQKKQQEIVNETLEDAKDNIRRTTDTAIKEVPRYTKFFNDYQEQTIQTARDISTSYIDTQKEMLRSFQAALDPIIDNMIDRIKNNYYYYYWPYPKTTGDV